MKKKVIRYTNMLIAYLLLINIFIYAQESGLEALKNNPQFEVKITDDGVLEVKDKKTNYRYLKNINKYPVKDNAATADLVIDLDTVNFANYDYLYREWGSVPVENHQGKFLVVDANSNEKNEIYAPFWEPAINLPVRSVYENVVDSVFNSVYQSQDTISSFRDVGDITGNGLLGIIGRDLDNRMHFYKQSSNQNYINTPDFIYAPFPRQFQPNVNTFYDLDGDGILEMIYFLFAGPDSIWAYSNHVAKYNPQINNYELAYYHRPLPDFFTFGFSVGDFDEDGKGNFGTGSINGKFYIYEYAEGTEYQVEYEDTLESFNAFLSQFTDDMDGNGKPEIWIGGDFSSSVYGGVTRLFAFEATGNGNYQQVYQVDILGLFSFFYGKIRYTDMDGDGIKDLVVTNGNLVFSFKSSGIGNYYLDFLYEVPPFNPPWEYVTLEGIDFTDLENDGKAEIISEYSLYNNGIRSSRSLFYKRNIVTSIIEDEIVIPETIELYPNYPNPFNPETNVRFTLPDETDVKLIIYNTLGKEIKTLIEGILPAGEYESNWDGTNDWGEKLPSGIYLITLSSKTFKKTVKALLIK